MTESTENMTKNTTEENIKMDKPEQKEAKQSRGRPVDKDKQVEQKQKLLKVAAELLSEKSYKSVTIRELGDRAGVNSAMIRYYFENKEGLFTALLSQMSSEHFEKMQSLTKSDDPIKDFIRFMLQMLNQNSGLARIIHDEILAEESALKAAFLERFPKRMATFLPNLIEQQIQQKKFRDDINPKYAAFSLMGLIVTPFMAAPIREEAWKISADELKEPQWVEHLYRTFMYGYSRENR
ncbi:TetR/AcrR family transcriptional regulator [Aliikangiella coralliicola]|uniref:TetR/AcrR family transcriptional regulator n=1 Tax=Aliikangiella coralliicola TaxID=2592383 RepID=A0A545UGY4_9GAMM|nr:TetR/AcrR family transcriptional regulator [Aliikangiella coralliicola]TQV88725.1 TetR/AcrR family transcriptional regulator [Aliikangiella coralliicola]